MATDDVSQKMDDTLDDPRGPGQLFTARGRVVKEGNVYRYYGLAQIDGEKRKCSFNGTAQEKPIDVQTIERQGTDMNYLRQALKGFEKTAEESVENTFQDCGQTSILPADLPLYTSTPREDDPVSKHSSRKFVSLPQKTDDIEWLSSTDEELSLNNTQLTQAEDSNLEWLSPTSSTNHKSTNSEKKGNTWSDDGEKDSGPEYPLLKNSNSLGLNETPFETVENHATTEEAVLLADQKILDEPLETEKLDPSETASSKYGTIFQDSSPNFSVQKGPHNPSPTAVLLADTDTDESEFETADQKSDQAVAVSRVTQNKWNSETSGSKFANSAPKRVNRKKKRTIKSPHSHLLSSVCRTRGRWKNRNPTLCKTASAFLRSVLDHLELCGSVKATDRKIIKPMHMKKAESDPEFCQLLPVIIVNPGSTHVQP